LTANIQTPPECSIKNIPLAAVKSERRRSDDSFDGDVQSSRNALDAYRIAVSALFQGSDFGGRKATGYCQLVDGVAGVVSGCQYLSGKWSAGFLIGIWL